MKPAAAQHSHPGAEAAHAISAAVAQMGLALRESQDPVTELGALLSRMSVALGQLREERRSPGTGPVAPAAADVGLLDQLQADVFNGIQQLQFHDRMVQHLSHLQVYLIAVANELANALPDSPGREAWEQMHARLRTRLISDEQRGVLDLFLWPDTPTRVSAQSARSDFAPPGSFEIF